MKFEYKILSVSRQHMKRESFQTEMLAKFNAFGEEGWELVSTEALTGTSIFWQYGQTTEVVFVFKRSR